MSTFHETFKAVEEMALSTGVDEFHQRVEKCREEDKKRQELFDELLAKLQTTTEELNRAKLDLENETSARRALQEQTKHLTSKLTARPYVLFMIDADGYPFNHMNEGEKGGRKIADCVFATIKAQLQKMGRDFAQCDVLVETYANTEGLGQALMAKGQLRSIDELRLFYSGFVCRQRMFAHVDVGRGKEHADQRIRERVEFHSGIWQCKQVFLACCHDEGYATFLGQFVSAGKITLVKNEVCHPRLEALGFPIVEFSELFFRPLAPKVVAVPLGKKKALQNPYAWQNRLGAPLFDPNNGLRYDKTLKVKPDLVKNVEKMGLCFYFYLTGSCKGCDRVHEAGRKLTVDEFDAVWFVARRGECYSSRKKKVCNDALCIYGHKAQP